MSNHVAAAILESELLAGIETSLRLHLEDNAVFLSERLFAEFPSQSSLLKVAESYNRAGDAGTALRLLRHHAPFNQLPANTQQDGDDRATKNNSDSAGDNNLFTNTPRWKLFYLMGVLAAKSHQYPEAERTLSPLLGCSVLAQPDQDSDSLFQAQVEAREAEAGVRYWLGVCGCHQGEAARTRPGTRFTECVQGAPALFAAFEEGVRRTENAAAPPPPANLALGTNNNNTNNNVYALLIHSAEHEEQQEQQQQQGDDSSIGGGGGGGVIANAAALRKKRQGTIVLSRFLLTFAEVLRLVHGAYDSNSALVVLHGSGSPKQKFSGWCLEQQAMAFFHSGRTQDAIATFEQLRQREPWRLNTPAMVYYSTCLWHGRQEVQLCALAQRLIDGVPRSPYTLCVVGNCHSLNRDARAAATMFSRATSVKPNFAYAHTLRGHELLALEEVQEAESAFYEALRWDKRHYAAFAGLGETYFRLEKEGPARENFRSALKINATLPAVLCRLAATYHRVGATSSDLEMALSLYEKSLERCPTHLPSAQQRASLLVRLGRLQPAMEALNSLLNECPEEPSLHVALGKCHAKLGNGDAAVRSFHRAMDLDPRRHASVRVLLERVAAGKDVDAVEH